ncbi:hypothetical protein LINGRAHAP2_LOCUS22415 [Linum grandiflorum]
MSAASEQ